MDGVVVVVMPFGKLFSRSPPVTTKSHLLPFAVSQLSRRFTRRMMQSTSSSIRLLLPPPLLTVLIVYPVLMCYINRAYPALRW
jgi:hypothetical protein